MDTLRKDEIWLQAHCFYSPAAFAALIQTFGDATTALKRKSAWRKVVPSSSLVKPSLSREDLFRTLAEENIHVVHLEDGSYPPLLKEIADPPPLLYLKGKQSLLKRQTVAVVGARRATYYGIEVAESIAQRLVEAGVVVVSGGARGIDSAAHKGALKKGSTVAVMGTGLNIAYPRENAKLFSRIAEGGVLLSEFPLGVGPLPHHFPLRNRIISGLSLGVIVVEGKEKSGAMITAHLAAEQGREVFAVPGKITSALSVGPHRLIQEGAKCVQDVDDILGELQIEPVASSVPTLPPLTGEEREIIMLFQDDMIAMDTLFAKSNRSLQEAMSLVTSLEMKGYIQRLPGQKIALLVREG